MSDVEQNNGPCRLCQDVQSENLDGPAVNGSAVESAHLYRCDWDAATAVLLMLSHECMRCICQLYAISELLVPTA